MKKICLLLCLLLCFSPIAAFAEGNATADYVYNAASSPKVSSVGGEWAVIGLERFGYNLPQTYKDDYYAALTSVLNENNGELSRKYTDYSRVLIALASIGKKHGIAGGYNIIDKLEDFERVTSQGINGSIWALIALDACDAETDLREKYLDSIVGRQNSDGGWALSGDVSEPDTTAMALTALSPYKTEFSEAIDRGVEFLKESIDENGRFLYGGMQSSESSAQVVTALCSLGISPIGFSKDGGKTALQGLESFKNPDGGFRHTDESAKSNQMATEQALLAYAALNRFKKGECSLYDMSDAGGECFSDIDNIFGKEKIENLAAAGIVSGKSRGVFSPNDYITRAEFATIAVNALKIPAEKTDVFLDVAENDWFFGTVSAAYNHKIVSGVSKTEFMPRDLINFEQAAVMLRGAAELLDIKAPSESGAALPSGISSWAAEDFEFCVSSGIFEMSAAAFEPKKSVTRAEMAVMIYNLLEVGNKI